MQRRIGWMAAVGVALALAVCGCGPAGSTVGTENNGAAANENRGSQPVKPPVPPLADAKKAVVAFLSALATDHKEEAAKWVLSSEHDWFVENFVNRDDNVFSGARFEVGPPEAGANGAAEVPVLILMGETMLDSNHVYVCRVDLDNRWRVKLKPDAPAASERATPTAAQWTSITGAMHELADALAIWFLRNPTWGDLSAGRHRLPKVAAAIGLEVPASAIAPFRATDVEVELESDGHFTIRVRSSAPDGPLGEYELDDMLNESGPQ